jgi:hypothetical protein
LVCILNASTCQERVRRSKHINTKRIYVNRVGDLLRERLSKNDIHYQHEYKYSQAPYIHSLKIPGCNHHYPNNPPVSYLAPSF